MNQSKKRGKGSLIVIIFLLLIIILGITANVMIFFKYKMQKAVKTSGAVFYSQEEISQIEKEAAAAAREDFKANMKSQLAGGTGINSLLRSYFPDQLIYTDAGRYYFQDINFNLKQNQLNNKNFILSENGEVRYEENGSVTSIKGIDISRYQGTVDFSKVKNSGVQFAMIRCGYRGYAGGQITADSSFDTYMRGANNNGVDVGVYFFTQAINKEEAVEEAEYVINKIKNYNVNYPIVIDVEEGSSTESYRQQNLNKQQLTDVIIAFCDRIKEAGYTPMVYSNLKYFASRVEFDRLEAYDKWYAYYADVPYMPYEFSMWQYTDSGKVDGISGNVDINLCFKKWK